MDDELTRAPSLKWSRERLLDECSRRGFEIERLRPIKARARFVMRHDEPIYSIPLPELHWIARYILEGDPPD
jgi:hypothetical protein